MAEPVRIPLIVEGADQAESSLLRIQSIIERMNSGGGSFAGMPTGAPAYGPPGGSVAPDPYAGYSHVVNTPGYGTPPTPGANPFSDLVDQFLQRPGSYGAPPPPAYGSPDPYAGYSHVVSGPPGYNNSGVPPSGAPDFSKLLTSFDRFADDIRTMMARFSSGPIGGSGGSYSGATSAAGGSYGSFGGRTQTAAPPPYERKYETAGSDPLSQLANGSQSGEDWIGEGGETPFGFTPFEGGQSWGKAFGYMQDMAGARNIGGFVNAGRGLAGAVPYGGALAGIAAGGFVVGTAYDQAMRWQFNAWQPQYQADTQIMATAAAGQYISPATQAYMSRVATQRGNLAQAQQMWNLGVNNPVSKLAEGLILGPGGNDMANLWWQQNYAMPRERGIAINTAHEQSAPMAMYLGAEADRTYSNLDDPYLSLRSSLASSFGFFGPNGVRSLENLNVSGMAANYGGTQAVQSGLQSLLSVAQMPQYGDMFKLLASGKVSALDPRILQTAIKQDIFAGTPESIMMLQALKPIIDHEFPGTSQWDTNQAFNTEQTRLQQSIFGSQYSGAQSNIQTMQATGSPFLSVSLAQSESTTFLRQLVEIDQQLLEQAKANNNQQGVAQISADIASLNASIAQTKLTAFNTAYQAYDYRTQTANVAAQNAMTVGMYGHNASYGGIYAGFQSQFTAAQYNIQEAEYWLNNPSLTPEQRQLALQQLQSARLQASVLIPRAMGQTEIQQAQGNIAIAGAQTSMGLTNADLYGSPQDVYSATVANAQATMGGTISLLKRELAPGNPFDLSPQELQSAQAQLISTTKKLSKTLTEASRNFQSMSYQVAQTTFAIGQTNTQMQISSFGVGGTAAGSLILGNVGQAGDVLDKANAKLQNLIKQGVKPDSDTYKAAALDVANAQANYFGTENSMANAPMPAAFQSAMLANSFAINAMSSTYASWGDIRGAYTQQLGMIGTELQTNNSVRGQAIQQIYADLQAGRITPDQLQGRLDSANLAFDQKQYALGNQAIQAQNQLEYGWQDRLVSSVVNAPERTAFVASQFTQFEAASFLQNIAPNFGFVGAGGPAARDYYMNTIPKLAQSLIGNVNRPEGFMATAMSGATPPGAGGTMQDWWNLARTANSPLTPNGGMPPGGMLIQHTPTSTQIQVDVHVSDDRTRVTVKDKNGNPIASGQGAPAVHAVINSPNTPPPYASSSSHQ